MMRIVAFLLVTLGLFFGVSLCVEGDNSHPSDTVSLCANSHSEESDTSCPCGQCCCSPLSICIGCVALTHKMMLLSLRPFSDTETRTTFLYQNKYTFHYFSTCFQPPQIGA